MWKHPGVHGCLIPQIWLQAPDRCVCDVKPFLLAAEADSKSHAHPEIHLVPKVIIRSLFECFGLFLSNTQWNKVWNKEFTEAPTQADSRKPCTWTSSPFPWLPCGIRGVFGGSPPPGCHPQMEAHQHSPDSSSEECTVLEAPPGKNACPQHAGKVGKCIRQPIHTHDNQQKAEIQHWDCWRRLPEVCPLFLCHLRSPFHLQVADLYCSACECALCEDCVSEHEEHPKVALSQALEQHRSSLQEKLGTVQNR